MLLTSKTNYFEEAPALHTLLAPDWICVLLVVLLKNRIVSDSALFSIHTNGAAAWTSINLNFYLHFRDTAAHLVQMIPLYWVQLQRFPQDFLQWFLLTFHDDFSKSLISDLFSKIDFAIHNFTQTFTMTYPRIFQSSSLSSETERCMLEEGLVWIPFHSGRTNDLLFLCNLLLNCTPTMIRTCSFLLIEWLLPFCKA